MLATGQARRGICGPEDGISSARVTGLCVGKGSIPLVSLAPRCKQRQDHSGEGRGTACRAVTDIRCSRWPPVTLLGKIRQSLGFK